MHSPKEGSKKYLLDIDNSGKQYIISNRYQERGRGHDNLSFENAAKVKRDNCIIAILKEHRGVNNAIPTKEIAKQLQSKGFNTNANTVTEIVKQIMYERNLPICSSNTKGYFWASFKADLDHTISDLESRMIALQEHIEFLQQFYIY